MMVNTFFEGKVDQLVDVAKRFHAALSQAGIEYRIVGGFAVFLHVDRADPLKARLTRDIDAAVRRSDLEAIAQAVKPYGFEYRHAAGVDMIVDAREPQARSAVHLILASEKVRADYLYAVPDFEPVDPAEHGLMIAPVEHLVKMKLTSFRRKDQVHIEDMDQAGLITSEIEASLPEPLRERLAHIRATE